MAGRLAERKVLVLLAEGFDEAAFRDGTIVWGRVVENIPDFCRELVAAVELA